MATYGAVRIRERVHWNPSVLSVPIGLAVGLYGLSWGRDWRLAVSVTPHDLAPERGMLLVAALAAAAMLGGLGLMTRARGPVGAWLFAIGVGLVSGAMFGFVTGPTGASELATLASGL